jgi:hypothetical protein
MILRKLWVKFRAKKTGVKFAENVENTGGGTPL